MVDSRQSSAIHFCPVCGASLDTGAAQCPRCSARFCAKCRQRLHHDDPQYQCVNQVCRFDGKLLCGNCTIVEPPLGRNLTPEGQGAQVGVVIATVVPALFLGIGVGYTAGIWTGISVGVLVGFVGFVCANMPMRSSTIRDWAGGSSEPDSILITDDIPRFVVCSACKHRVELFDGCSEAAKAKAEERLHEGA
jgi:hypothetical protein